MNDDETTETPTAEIAAHGPADEPTTVLQHDGLEEEDREPGSTRAWSGLPRGRAWVGAAAALVAVSGLTGFGIGHATANGGSDLAPASATVDPGSPDGSAADDEGRTGPGPRMGGPGAGAPPALPPETVTPDESGTTVPDTSSSI